MITSEVEALNVFKRKFPNSEIKVVHDELVEVDGLDLYKTENKWTVSQITGYYDNDTGWETDHEDLGSFDSLALAVGFAIIEAVKNKVNDTKIEIDHNIDYMEESVLQVSAA